MKSYSKRRKKSRSLRAGAKKSTTKKSEQKEFSFSERRLVALAFGDIVTKKKPRFYESWDKTTRENYFEISVESISPLKNMEIGATGLEIVSETTVLYISWAFKAINRYCCISPMCFLGKWPGPKKKEWWQEFRKALKKRNFDKELSQIRIILTVTMPELEIEHRENHFTYVGPHSSSYDWREIRAVK